jgi:hypothetical protein
LSNDDSHTRFERSMNEVTESRHDADPSVKIKVMNINLLRQLRSCRSWQLFGQLGIV